MKKCPLCAEEIQDEAVKCRFCGEFIEQKPTVKWYFTTSSIIVSFLCVGPLALPLVWFNPHYTKKAKIIITIIVVVVTYALMVVMNKMLGNIRDYYAVIFETLEQ